MPRRQRLIRLPIILQLALIASLSMLVPAAHAAVASDWRIARIFLHSAIGCTLILTLLSIAMAGRPPADRTRAVLPTTPPRVTPPATTQAPVVTPPPTTQAP